LELAIYSSPDIYSDEIPDEKSHEVTAKIITTNRLRNHLSERIFLDLKLEEIAFIRSQIRTALS